MKILNSLLIATIIIGGIAGIAIYFGASDNVGPDLAKNNGGKNSSSEQVATTNDNNQTEEATAVEENIIIIGKEYSGVYEKGNMDYYYQINDSARIVFLYRGDWNASDTGNKWAGDVILENEDDKIILLKDVAIMGPGGRNFVVFATNNPNILLLRRADGDLGAWSQADYYLDLNQNKIVFQITNGSNYILSAQKENLPAIELSFNVVGDCGKNPGERQGKTAQITDLALNGKAANVLKAPIELGCDNEAMFGPGYYPPIYFEPAKIESDFSKFHFALTGKIYENKASKELWKHEFYIYTNDQDAKIYPE